MFNFFEFYINGNKTKKKNKDGGVKITSEKKKTLKNSSTVKSKEGKEISNENPGNDGKKNVRVGGKKLKIKGLNLSKKK